MRSQEELWQLTLYVAGSTGKSMAAQTNLKKYCEQYLKGQYAINVVDLMKEPQLAESDQILAIPTLVRKSPSPVKKIIGDLSNSEKVLHYLDITH